MPSLLRKWKKVLSKPNSEIGIHKDDKHTRAATAALLDMFRKSFDGDRVNPMLSIQKLNSRKNRNSNSSTTSAVEVSSDEELSSSEYTTYRDYIPWTQHTAILHQHCIDIGDAATLNTLAGHSNLRKKIEKAAPPKPKKPFNPYMLFNNDMRPQIKAKYPGLRPNDHIRKIGDLWKKLSDEDKAPYIKKSGKLKAIYKQKKAEWEMQMSVYEESNSHYMEGESDSDAFDADDTLREEIMEIIVPRYIELKMQLGEAHPKVLSMRMVLKQFGLLEYSTKVEVRSREAKNRKRLPTAKSMLNRRIELADSDGEMFPGTITNVKKGTSKSGVKDVVLVCVLYDDGETDTDLDLATEEFSWLEEPSSAEDAEND